MTNPSTIWTQLALPNSPIGSIPFVTTDSISIIIDVLNFNYLQNQAIGLGGVINPSAGLFTAANAAILGLLTAKFQAGGSVTTFIPRGFITKAWVQTQTPADIVAHILQTAVIKANTLNLVGTVLEAEFSGIFGATANNKTISVQVGGTTICSIGPSALNGVPYLIKFRVIKTAANTQLILGIIEIIANVTPFRTTTAIVDTADMTITFTGQNGTATAGDIISDGYSVAVGS